MATSASPPTLLSTKSVTNLPDPKSVTDKASASDALTSALAVVATANRALDTGPRDLATLHGDLKAIFKELHELLPKIAAFRADITGWSVTVGMSNTLTVNFLNKPA